jgi:hypothetical protein
VNPAHTDGGTERLYVGGPGVAWRETAGEIVVLDLEGSVYFGLNGTAASLWRRLTSTASRADLIALLHNLGADASQAARDVDDFLAELARFSLLGRQPPADSA